ncbi:MAG: hypothetical protein H5T84_00450, partial [Thermoleophilia bacterium]|nr:hypothetical protein [Thermoleophilia bacterium]
YCIVLPKDESFEPETARRFTEYLLRTTVHLALQIVAEKDSIWWEITDWRSDLHPDHILRAVNTYYPKAQVDWGVDQGEQHQYPFYRYVLFFKQGAEFFWPIKYVDDLKGFDPLAAVTQAMSGLQAGERITYSVVMSVPADYAHALGEKMITTSTIHPLQFVSTTGLNLIADAAAGPRGRVEKYRASDRVVAEQKLNRPLYQCF